MKPCTYRRSAAAWRVRGALAVKGIADDRVRVNLLTGARRAADYAARPETRPDAIRKAST
jgi:glutathione S-transferase